MALIKERLGLDARMVGGGIGQFEVKADGRTVVQRGGNWFTRMFGSGYPDLDGIVDQIDRLRPR